MPFYASWKVHTPTFFKVFSAAPLPSPRSGSALPNPAWTSGPGSLDCKGRNTRSLPVKQSQKEAFTENSAGLVAIQGCWGAVYGRAAPGV